jgi:hypothetical protein
MEETIMYLKNNVRLPMSDDIGQEVIAGYWKIMERSIIDSIQKDGSLMHHNVCKIGGWILELDMNNWGVDGVNQKKPMSIVSVGGTASVLYLLTTDENLNFPESFFIKMRESIINEQDLDQEMNMHSCDPSLISTGFIGFQNAEAIS